MKKLVNLLTFILLLTVPFACSGQKKDKGSKAKKEEVAPISTVVYLNTATFKERVWNYDQNKENWVYEGDLPCIVDFYADWCRPCKMLAPVLDELATEYAGKIIIYKIDVDKEKELASAFGVQSIPTILFCPKSGQPAIQPGFLQKDQLIEAFNSFLLGESVK